MEIHICFPEVYSPDKYVQHIEYCKNKILSDVLVKTRDTSLGHFFDAEVPVCTLRFNAVAVAINICTVT